MFRNLIAGVALAIAALPAFAADVRAMLKEADNFRITADAMVVDTQVQVMKGGQLDKERRYTVFVKPGRRSIVLFKSPAEIGQKMLMTGEDFFLLMPGTGRPIRVTPQQKLLGDASTGDIATMTWADDYAGTVVGEETVEGKPCVRLHLEATRAGVSYARIELYVAKGSGEPVRADLYVASDKLAKQAFFQLELLDGRRQVTVMRLVDQIQTNRETLVRYVSRKPKTLPDEYFNPMFLSRSEIRE